MKHLNFIFLTILTIFAHLFGSMKSVKAETCIPLDLVGGQGTRVTKTVSEPTIPGPFGVTIARNNWNTDWAIPGGRNWQRFIVNVVPEASDTFNIRMYLKYPDQTAEEIYNNGETIISPQQPLQVIAKPQPDQEPYQVNLFVGELASIGNTYTASVLGCY